MILTNLTDFPPNGYLYREPSLGWEAPRELAVQGLRQVAQALQVVRSQNPASGLDPSYEACVRSIGEFTCQRLAPWPDKQRFFCGGGETTPQEKAAAEAARRRVEQPRGCASCGGRR